MVKYKHKVQYYETDKMQITHHSNYVRIMEEARTYYLEQIGYSYQRMEDENLISPVVKINLDFKKSTTYADEIEVEVKIKDVSPVKIEFEYLMTCRGNVVCQATSLHCFIDKEGRPIIIKRANPKLFELMLSLKEN